MIFLLVGEMVKRGGEYFFIGKQGFLLENMVFLLQRNLTDLAGMIFVLVAPSDHFHGYDISVGDQREFHSGGGNCCG